MEQLTLQEATDFFAEFFGGEHRIMEPIKPYGHAGWSVKTNQDLATYDFNRMTRLVVMAHDKCYRVEAMPANTGRIKIAIWKRQREGDITECHPTMEKAIETIRSNYGDKFKNSIQ